MHPNNNFAAFIITYERPEIILGTINKIFDQTLPPQKVLIVDNSDTIKTEKIFKQSIDSRIEYYRVGYNSGPAGGARIGLEKLAQQGFEWIFWGDDNDPPNSDTCFEEQLILAKLDPQVGVVGRVGGKFNKTTGRISGFYNKELTKVVDADYIAGGQLMIVNSKVVAMNILPEEKLFFSFEDLDFCLKVKHAGFRIIFDGERIKNGREQIGKDSPNYKWRGRSFGNELILWRQYYSFRNLLFILLRRKYFVAYCYVLLRNLFKVPLSIRYGLAYFNKFSKVQFYAVWHHVTGRYGKVDSIL